MKQKTRIVRIVVRLLHLFMAVIITGIAGGFFPFPNHETQCREQQPRPSPDGNSLAFRSDCGGEFRLHILSLVDGKARRFNTIDERGIGPSWSPDASAIVYYIVRGDERDIKVYDVATESSRVITTGPYDQTPAWSPDGRHIFFAAGDGPPDDPPSIFAINPDGTGRERIGGTSGANWGPAWSPSGREIAFNSGFEGRLAIFLMNADGSSVRALDSIALSAETPAWSPDGALIAFQAVASDNSDVYVYDIDTAQVTRLTSNPGRDETPSWSADGRVYFQSDRDGDMDIFVMNADGSDQTKITIAYD